MKKYKFKILPSIVGTDFEIEVLRISNVPGENRSFGKLRMSSSEWTDFSALLMAGSKTFKEYFNVTISNLIPFSGDGT